MSMFARESETIKLSIRVAGNTMIPCLQAIKAKGYTIRNWYITEDNDDLSGQWDAYKDGCLFSATNPEELLGLIAMWEVRGDNWRLSGDEGEIYDQLTSSADVYDKDGNLVED